MDPLTVGLIGGTVVSGLLGSNAEYDAQMAMAESYNRKADLYAISADRARFQGELDSLQLTTNFNDMMANNAVMAAAQGRTFSGSVEAVAKGAETKVNWDKDFAKLSAEYEAQGAKILEADSRLAAIETKAQAGASRNISLLNTGLTAAKLGA